MSTSWKSTPRCPRSSWQRSPRLLSAFATWSVLTPGLFTPCLPDTWNHETFFHTDQAAFPYLGIGLKIFLITRPWPAFGRQGTLLTPCFAPAALSSEGTWSNSSLETGKTEKSFENNDRDFVISRFLDTFEHGKCRETGERQISMKNNFFSVSSHSGTVQKLLWTYWDGPWNWASILTTSRGPYNDLVCITS